MSEFVCLRELIAKGSVPSRALALLQRDLVDILVLRQDEDDEQPTICAENILFDSEFNEIFIEDNLRINGYKDDISQYGHLLKEVLASLPIKQKKLATVAEKCTAGEYVNAHEIQLALEKRISNTIYIPLIAIIAILMALLAWFSN